MDIHDVVKIIDNDEYIDIIDVLSQTNHPNQRMYIIRLNGYIHCVPFVEDKRGGIFIKTVFPSRKFNAIYGKGESNYDA